MISRGEVGLIVTAMGATTGIFGKSEVAVMVAVVLLTTLITPIALRSAFNMNSKEDSEDARELVASSSVSVSSPELPVAPAADDPQPAQDLSKGASFRTGLGHQEGLLNFSQTEVASD
jgi:hypothetical protein